MRISSILSNKNGEVLTVTPETKIATVAQMLRKHRIGAVLVAQNGSTLGMLSERDIVRGLADSGGGCLDMPASELMSHPVVTCSPDESIDDAMSTMTEKRFRHLPVMSDDKIIGMVSIGDIVKSKIEEIEHEAEEMRSYIAST